VIEDVCDVQGEKDARNGHDPVPGSVEDMHHPTRVGPVTG
jgi:hypothetical protein